MSKYIKEGAELVEGRMSFIQKFLQKKYGAEILFFTIIVLGFITAVWFYKQGEAAGEKDSKETVASLEYSLKSTRYSDSIEIRTYNNRLNYFRQRLDSCNQSSLNTNLEEMLTKKLEEAERIKRLVERNIDNDRKDVKIIEKIIKD